VHGLEAHAGVCPERGISAVRVASQGISAMPLGRIDDQTTANVVIVSCPTATNVVPNRCVVRGESRSLDDGRLEETTSQIRRAFQDAAAVHKVTFDGKDHRAWVEERIERVYHSMRVADDAPIVERVMRAAKKAKHALATASIGGEYDRSFFANVDIFFFFARIRVLLGGANSLVGRRRRRVYRTDDQALVFHPATRTILVEVGSVGCFSSGTPD